MSVAQLINATTDGIKQLCQEDQDCECVEQDYIFPRKGIPQEVSELSLIQLNCGVGSVGFEPGNSCAAGGGDGGNSAPKKSSGG